MANDELLTDEYVAGLLAKEAKDASAKYSAMGLEAYNSSRYVFCSSPISRVRRRRAALTAEEGPRTSSSPTRASCATSSRRQRTTTRRCWQGKPPSRRRGCRTWPRRRTRRGSGTSLSRGRLGTASSATSLPYWGARSAGELRKRKGRSSWAQRGRACPVYQNKS